MNSANMCSEKYIHNLCTYTKYCTYVSQTMLSHIVYACPFLDFTVGNTSYVYVGVYKFNYTCIF